jgi:glycosyltransferase involved in cell wall biosynthesis
MSNNVIATVFYPNAKSFIKEFLDSVEKQSCNNFTLVIFNNGLKNSRELLKESKIEYIIKDIKMSPSYAREALIKYVVYKKYENIIFADCDDIMPINRVKHTLSKLDYCNIVVNDLTLFNHNKILSKKHFSHRFTNKQKITLDMIYHQNMMGLSNTAAKVTVLNLNLKPTNEDLRVYDWYLWSKILLNNHTATFFNDVTIKYRIHDNNVSSLNSKITKKEALNGITIKKEHYKELKNDNKIFDNLYNNFKQIYNNFKSPEWSQLYLNHINSKKIFFPFWWEKIMLPNKML